MRLNILANSLNFGQVSLPLEFPKKCYQYQTIKNVGLYLLLSTTNAGSNLEGHIKDESFFSDLDFSCVKNMTIGDNSLVFQAMFETLKLD